MANEGRSVFEKVFLIDKKYFLEFARKEAMVEHGERGNLELYITSLKKDFEAVFNGRDLNEYADFFWEKHKKLFFSDSTAVISEDRAGRLPAEIVHEAINIVRKKKGLSHVPLLGLDASRSVSESEIKNQMKTWISRGLLQGSVFYVTEMVYTGASQKKIGNALKSLDHPKDLHIKGITLIGRWGDVSQFGPPSDNQELGDDFYERYSGLDAMSNSEKKVRAQIVEDVSEWLADKIKQMELIWSHSSDS